MAAVPRSSKLHNDQELELCFRFRVDDKPTKWEKRERPDKRPSAENGENPRNGRGAREENQEGKRLGEWDKRSRSRAGKEGSRGRHHQRHHHAPNDLLLSHQLSAFTLRNSDPTQKKRKLSTNPPLFLLSADLPWGLNKGRPTTVRVLAPKPSYRKGKSSARTAFVKALVREVVGFAPYERRVMELIRNSKDKKARKLTKKRVSFFLRSLFVRARERVGSSG